MQWSVKDYIANEAQLYVIDSRSVKDYIVNEAQLYIIESRSVKDYIVSYQPQSPILSKLALAPNQPISDWRPPRRVSHKHCPECPLEPNPGFDFD